MHKNKPYENKQLLEATNLPFFSCKIKQLIFLKHVLFIFKQISQQDFDKYLKY